MALLYKEEGEHTKGVEGSRGCLPLQMPPNKLYWGLHRRIRKGTGRQNQRTPQGPLSHSPSQQFHRTSPKPTMLQHHTSEAQGPSRNVTEAMFIHVNDPSLNRNLGKYQLPHIWDNILQGTPALQVKQSNLPSPLTLTGTSPLSCFQTSP